MAQTSFVEESIDRVQEAFRNVESEVEKLQKDAEKRVKHFQKDTEKRVKRLRTDIRKSDVYKRAESLRKDVTRQWDHGVETLLSNLQIASQGDLRRLDRKLGQISRKLTALEKARGQKTPPAA